jgi:predicted amidohydrolase
MQKVTVACVQPRMIIPANREEFVAEARRFLRQAQAKGAGITIFPEWTGLMLAPPLISSFKLGFVKREDQGKRPGAGFMSRGMGRLAGTTAGALGGGFRGSLGRLLRKKGDVLRDLYLETFSGLAREFGTAIVGASLYLVDQETETVRHRAFVFDVDGTLLGSQDKLNLAPDEQEMAAPGADLAVVPTRFGRLGVLIGRDALYPELSRLLAVQGVDLIAGIAASSGAAQANMVRSALALRAEENQVFVAASFLLGPNYLGRDKTQDFYGQSAVFAPISLTPAGDGLLVQAGTNRTEGLIAAELDGEGLAALWQTSRFRPRQEMNLGNSGPVLAEIYRQGLTIDQAVEQRIAGPIEPVKAVFEPVAVPVEAAAEGELPFLPAAEVPAFSPSGEAEKEE